MEKPIFHGSSSIPDEDRAFRNEFSTHDASRAWRLPLLMAVITFITALAGIALSTSVERIAMIWMANAIMLAFCLRLPTQTWPRLFLGFCAGSFAANMTMGDGLLLSTAFMLANALEIAVVATPLRILELSDFTRPRTLCVFYPLAMGPATILSSVVAAGALWISDRFAFWQQAQMWYASDMLGLVTLTPLLVSTTRSDIERQIRGDRAPLNLLILSRLVHARLCRVIFSRAGPSLSDRFRRSSLLPSAWASRVEPRCSCPFRRRFCHSATFSDFNPWPGMRTRFTSRVYFAQFFLAVTSFTIQQIGGALAERRGWKIRLDARSSIARRKRTGGNRQCR